MGHRKNVPVLPMLLAVPIADLLSACAGQHTTHTGFISSYDGMKPSKKHSYDLIYVNPTYVPTNYMQVFIEPVVWEPASNTPKRDIEVIGRLQVAFAKSLHDTLTKDYAVVSPPGPKV